MLKPLMFSLSLAVALGICSVSKAGGFDSNCTTCGLASPQGVIASPQGCAVADPCVACAPACAPKCHFSFHLPQIHFSCPKIVHNTCYEWVLQKKHSFSFVHGSLSCGSPCGPAGCGPAPCGPGPVYPTGQGIIPSGQGVAPVYGASQQAYRGMKPAASIASAPAEMTPAVATGEEAPPAPEVRGTAATAVQNGGLLLPTPSGN
jgi:hypothetical protein